MSGWPWSGYIHQSSNRIYDKSLQQESARPAAKQTQFARHILTSSSSSYAVRREKRKRNLTKLGIGSKMFPQFGATAETLSKASTMVFRIGTDAHLYDDPEDVTSPRSSTASSTPRNARPSSGCSLSSPRASTSPISSPRSLS
jgi:hypothetical protein